jgi:hypothetical protein
VDTILYLSYVLAKQFKVLAYNKKVKNTLDINHVLEHFSSQQPQYPYNN